MKKSRRNFLPLVVSVISQNLHVDGYRPTEATAGRSSCARQASRDGGHSELAHGEPTAWRAPPGAPGSEVPMRVLPGRMSTDEEQAQDVPVIRPVSPRRMTAMYADDVDDEWLVRGRGRAVQLPKGKSRVSVAMTRSAMPGEPRHEPGDMKPAASYGHPDG